MTDRDVTFFGSNIIHAHTEDGLGGRRMVIDPDPGVLTVSNPATPTVDEALHRLRGRRADAIVNASTGRIVEETNGQNRKTRRNNLRLARLEVKARRAAVTNTVTLTDAGGTVTFERVSDDALRDFGIEPGVASAETPTGTVTVDRVGR